MNKRDDAGASPLELGVRPSAWLHRAENGAVVCWTSAYPESLRLAREIGFPLTPLYDQAALDATVAAERERWRALLADVSKQARHPDYDWPACLQREVDGALKA